MGSAFHMLCPGHGASNRVTAAADTDTDFFIAILVVQVRIHLGDCHSHTHAFIENYSQ